jgi:hypothetical protein
MSKQIANYEPRGTRFFANGKEMMLCLDNEPRESLRGWIVYKHPDGQWVTLRKATDADTEAISNAVIAAHHGDY